MTGAKPVFVDIGKDLNIDALNIERAITKKQGRLFQFIGLV